MFCSGPALGLQVASILSPIKARGQSRTAKPSPDTPGYPHISSQNPLIPALVGQTPRNVPNTNPNCPDKRPPILWSAQNRFIAKFASRLDGVPMLSMSQRLWARIWLHFDSMCRSGNVFGLHVASVLSPIMLVGSVGLQNPSQTRPFITTVPHKAPHEPPSTWADPAKGTAKGTQTIPTSDLTAAGVGKTDL